MNPIYQEESYWSGPLTKIYGSVERKRELRKALSS
jgi:hypothetical protein